MLTSFLAEAPNAGLHAIGRPVDRAVKITPGLLDDDRLRASGELDMDIASHEATGMGIGDLDDDALDAVAEAVERRYGRSLSGVDLEIRLIPRGRYTDMQRGALKEYWNEVFSELGLQADWRDL